MVKARKDGANHVHAILTGYGEAPADFKLADGMNYNEYFQGHQIAMPQPLYGDDVEYADGTKATLDQEAMDVTAFLTWAAEPKLEDRKALGIQVLLYLGVLFVMVVAVKKAVWRNVDH
jgi:ubiquinol-cytochrome c reductase cytochrome c1 subunit